MTPSIIKSALVYLLSAASFASRTQAVTKNFPFGPYTARPAEPVSVNEAREICDLDLSCAGVTSLSDFIKSTGSNNTNDIGDSAHEASRILAHSFLPTTITNATYQSTKEFTFHAGKVTNSNILEIKYGDMSVGQAKEYCRSHTNCVGFYHPVHNSQLHLENPDNITFVSSIESFESDEGDEWRTFIANDIKRASHVNASSLSYSQVVSIEHPFRSCCRKTEIPTISQVEQVDTLERIDCINISREDFYTHYESQRKPVMLVGCDEKWKAKSRWNYDSLIPRFDNDTQWRASLYDSEKLREDVKWSEIVDSIEKEKPFYIFDQLDHDAGKMLEEDYEWPDPVKGADLYANLVNFPESYGSRRWWTVGAQYSGTEPHMDPLSTDAWNSLTKGHKWWIIYPERVTDEEDLECDATCSVEEPTARHWYASVGINAARSEYADGERPFHVLQKPGETIYVPNGRIHSVFNMDETIAVTANYGSKGNFEEVWKTIVTEGTDSHWRKMYYQVFDKEQRKEARGSEFWPPEEYVGQGDDDDEDDEEADEEGNDEQFRAALLDVKRILTNENESTDAKREALWSLSKMDLHDEAQVEAVLDLDITETIISFLDDSSSIKALPALRIIGQIVSGSDGQAQAVIDAGIMSKVNALLTSSNKLIQKEACYVLSNISGGNDEQTSQVVNNEGTMENLVMLAMSDHRGVSREAIWTIGNIVASKDWHVTSAVKSGALNALYNSLESDHAKSILVALKSIDNILKVGVKIGVDYGYVMEDVDGLDRLVKLQNFKNEAVRRKAVELVHKYFPSLFA